MTETYVTVLSAAVVADVPTDNGSSQGMLHASYRSPRNNGSRNGPVTKVYVLAGRETARTTEYGTHPSPPCRASTVARNNENETEFPRWNAPGQPGRNLQRVYRASKHSMSVRVFWMIPVCSSPEWMSKV